MSAPRDIGQVIARVAPILEANGVDATRLKQIAMAAWFTAPECCASHWLKAGRWLAQALPPVRPGCPEWAKDVSDIWEGRREAQ